MLSFRRFFLVLLVTGVVSLPAVVAIDFFWKQKDSYTESLLQTFNLHQTDVLYFGDSSVILYGSQDKNTAGIDLLFQAKTGLSVCSIASPGYSAVLYSEYLHLLDKTRYQPRLVIIPINLRSFTGSSVRRPALNFPLRQIYIRYRSTGKIELLDYLKYRFLGLEERLTENWKDMPVVYDGNYLGTHRSIQDDCRIPEILDYRPDREHLYAQQLGKKFMYHYMAPVDSNDAMFSYLDETIRYLKKRGIPVLCYLTPVNFGDGRKYAGEAFTKRNEKNIAVIGQFMKERDVAFLDLATSLDPTYFVDKRDVYEHLDFKGRDFVAGSVAKSAKTLLFGVHE
jgi:hypothetical protein